MTPSTARPAVYFVLQECECLAAGAAYYECFVQVRLWDVPSEAVRVHFVRGRAVVVYAKMHAVDSVRERPSWFGSLLRFDLATVEMVDP